MQFREQNRDAWNHLAAVRQPVRQRRDRCRVRPAAALARYARLAPRQRAGARRAVPGRRRGLAVDPVCVGRRERDGRRSVPGDAAAGSSAKPQRRNLTVRTLEDSMDDLSALGDASFDIVHQPVSTCYVARLAPVYREIARVLRAGGLYISQHKQPTSLQIVDRDEQNRYRLGVGYYTNDPLPPVVDESYREEGTVEYLHRWEDLVGGLCRPASSSKTSREPRRGDPKATRPFQAPRHVRPAVRPHQSPPHRSPTDARRPQRHLDTGRVVAGLLRLTYGSPVIPGDVCPSTRNAQRLSPRRRLLHRPPGRTAGRRAGGWCSCC